MKTYLVVFTSNAPTLTYGPFLTDLDVTLPTGERHPVKAMSCSEVQESFAGMLRLCPVAKSQLPGEPVQEAVHVHASFVLTVREIALDRLPAGFVPATQPQQLAG